MGAEQDITDVTQGRIDAALLAGLGVLGVHQVAYLFAGVSTGVPSVAHGHLQYAWMLGSVASLVAVPHRYGFAPCTTQRPFTKRHGRPG